MRLGRVRRDAGVRSEGFGSPTDERGVAPVPPDLELAALMPALMPDTRDDTELLPRSVVAPAEGNLEIPPDA